LEYIPEQWADMAVMVHGLLLSKKFAEPFPDAAVEEYSSGVFGSYASWKKFVTVRTVAAKGSGLMLPFFAKANLPRCWEELLLVGTLARATPCSDFAKSHSL